MSKKTLQINLKFNVSKADYEEETSQLAQPIAGVKGLLWKLWLMNEAENEAGGIYLFEDESSMNAYLEGDIVDGLKKHPAISDIKVKIFDVMEKHSKITRGPID